MVSLTHISPVTGGHWPVSMAWLTGLNSLMSSLRPWSHWHTSLLWLVDTGQYPWLDWQDLTHWCPAWGHGLIDTHLSCDLWTLDSIHGLTDRNWPWSAVRFCQSLLKANFGLQILLLPASVWLCVSMCVPSPSYHLITVETRITKLGQKMQNSLVLIPIVFGVELWKSKFTFVWCESKILMPSLSTRVILKTIFDSLQLFQRRVCLFKTFGRWDTLTSSVFSVWCHILIIKAW